MDAAKVLDTILPASQPNCHYVWEESAFVSITLRAHVLKRQISTATSLLFNRLAYLGEMQILETTLPGVRIIRPKKHGDARGWFAETFNAREFEAAGLPGTFVQDNQSFSSRGVLRGLHYQLGQPQGKLVRVLSGHIWDVVVDVRRESASFGKWAGFHLRPLSEDGELEMLWVPEGFAHGFLVLSETAEVFYKVTRPYFPEGDRSILWNDPALGIEWPLEGITPSFSQKDLRGKVLAEAELE